MYERVSSLCSENREPRRTQWNSEKIRAWRAQCLETLSCNSTTADVMNFRIHETTATYLLWGLLLNCTPFIGKGPCLLHHTCPKFTSLLLGLNWYLFTTQLARKWEMLYLTQEWNNMLEYSTWAIRVIVYQKWNCYLAIRNLHKLFMIPRDYFIEWPSFRLFSYVFSEKNWDRIQG